MVDDFPSLRATDSSDNSDVDSGNVSAREIDTMKSDLGPQSPQQTAPAHTHMVDSNEDDPKSLYQSEEIVNMELDNIETEDGDAAAVVKKPKRIPKRRQTVDTTLELLNRTESMNNIMSRLDEIQKPIHDILKRLDTINKKLNTVNSAATRTTGTSTANTQTPVSNKSSSVSQPAKSKSIASKRKSIDTPLPSSSSASKKKRSNSEVANKQKKNTNNDNEDDDDDEHTGSDTDGDEVKKSMERNIRLYSIGSSDFYLMCRKKQNVIDGQKNLEKKFGQCNLLKTWNNRTNVKDIGKLILQKFPHLKWNARTNIITNCRNKQVSQSDLLSYLVKTIK